MPIKYKKDDLVSWTVILSAAAVACTMIIVAGTIIGTSYLITRPIEARLNTYLDSNDKRLSSIEQKLDTMLFEIQEQRLLLSQRPHRDDLINASTWEDLSAIISGKRERIQAFVDKALLNGNDPDFILSRHAAYIEALNRIQDSIDDKLQLINSRP